MRRAVALLATFSFMLNGLANPTGLTVTTGTAVAQQAGSQLNVTTSQNAFLNWQSFNIAAGERTVFNQPNAYSVVVNQINGQSASQIYGSLQANGIVVLMNSSGFYFGPNSFVSAGGLVVSTANCLPPQNSGGTWEFNGPPPLASIVNYGSIKVGNGGSAYLIADKIENYGNIEAPGGSIGLAAGQTVTLSERPDGRGMSMQVTLPQGSVNNYGNLIADAGTIALNARVVNQDGFIQANSVQNQNGVIELVASDSLSLGANSQIVAAGDDSAGGSAGGRVTLKSENSFSDVTGSEIMVAGGASGGNGGAVEISAPQITTLASSLDASAQIGSKAGQLLINSQDITLNASGANGMSGGTLNLNVNSTFAKFSQITLQTSGDPMTGSGNIALTAGTYWNLGPVGGQLIMDALGNMTLGTGSQLIAAGGTIRLYSKVLNQNGLIQANSVGDKRGIIELAASDSLNLGANSKITANGDDSLSGSSGGQIMIQSFQPFSDDPASQMQARGGVNGGDGGRLLLYAPAASVKSQLDVSAQPGSATGNIYYYSLVNSIVLTAGSLTPFIGFTRVLFQANNDITLAAGTSWNLSASTGQSSGQLTLEAGRNVYLGSKTSQSSASIFDTQSWSIAMYAGVTDFAHLTVAPIDPASKTRTDGSIYLDTKSTFSPSYIKTANGAITLVAAKDIKLGYAYVSTTGGGSINAHALSGNIDTGGYAQGYAFQAGDSASQGYYVDPSLGVGGISTIAGGGVNLTAGGNVLSVLPSVGGYYFDGVFYRLAANAKIVTAGAGAYGFASGQAGDVNIVAGGNVTGNYVVGNGVGKIFAGVTMDASGNPVKDAAGNYVLGGSGSAGTDLANPNLALNLVSGGWNVTAAHNIILQEVRNPNGVFNTVDGSSGSFHAFDYAPSDYVNLAAGNLVQLGASSSALPRLNSLDSLKVPVIYPGILNIVAGAGGVVLKGDSTFNKLILFPSPQGGLTINTTGGGSLSGSLPAISGTPQIFNLIISDSANRQYYKPSGDLFGLGDHAATPVHWNSEQPIALNISGDMNLILLGAPEAAQINVVGNMNNCRFQGMNLNTADTTSITVGQAAKINMENSHILDPATDGGLRVGGDIVNRGAFTFIDLNQIPGAQAPNFSVLSQAVNNPISGTTLATSFFYNPATKILTYQNIAGQSLATVLALLQNLTVQVYQNGFPVFEDAPFNTIPKTTSVSVLDTATAQALLAEYNALGPIPTGAGGYMLGGGGKFEVTARNMDLGTTSGIRSSGVGLYTVAGNYPLASYFTQGADISVNLTGNLDMFSSSIASLNGGGIAIRAGGDVNAGSSDFIVASLGARGIYSTAQGDVTVVADGNVKVNGSRIAAYDGGNVTVESVHGNVDAGTGASSPVGVQAFYVDPVTRKVYQTSPQIPFSGILALTFPPRSSSYPAPPAMLGNILVEALNGNVTANLSGILQIALNKLNYPAALVTVLAGYELQDAHGLPVVAGNMASGTAVPALSAQNLVTDQTLVGSGNRLKLVDKNGVASLDANGNPIYVTQLLDGNANTVFTDNSSISSGSLSKTLSERQLRLKLVGAGGQALLDANGDPIYVTQLTDANNAPRFVIGRNINANGSGIIASNARLDATGDINGLIFARNNIDIVAQQNVNVTALGEGSVSVGAGGSVSGTIIGVGGVSASGGSIDASLVSANVSGATSGQSGLGSGGAANATSTAASASDDSAKTAQKSDATGEDDLLKKKGKGIALAQKVSRVTVLLPQKN